MIFGKKFDQYKQELRDSVAVGTKSITVDPKLLLFCMEATEKSTQEYDDLTRKPSAFEKEEMRKHIIHLQEELGKLNAQLQTDLNPVMQENTALKIQLSSIKVLLEREKRKNETMVLFGEKNG